MERRSWGEILVGWLLLLWGLVIGTYTLVLFVNAGVIPALLGNIAFALGFLYSAFTCLGALAILVRRRVLAKWLLWAAALAALVVLALGLFVSYQIWHQINPHARQAILRIIVVIGLFLLTVTLGSFFIGRWIGQQEDIPDNSP